MSWLNKVLHMAKYFRPEEFVACTPSCSIENINPLSLNRLDLMRSIAGVPIVLTSAYRSPEYDKSKGRSGNGAHTRGRAFDIACGEHESLKRHRLVQAALEANFRRIGIGKTFIHVDDDPDLPGPCIWVY